MFKPSPRAILFAAVTFVAASALPGIALAKGGNGRNNGSSGTGNTSNAGGGPPACRDLEGSIDQLQSMLNSLNTQIATINANVNTINSNTNNLSARIDAINASITTMNTTLSTFTTRFDSIESSLDVLSEDIADIKATLDTEGVNAVQASVDVNTTACASGASQCGSTTVPNSTNQNPVALNILVTDGSTPITNLSSSNFLFNVPFTPNGQPMTFAACTSGDTGCGSGTFFVNSGNGAYQIWVSPGANWVPGTYAGLLTVNTPSGSTMQQVDFTILP